MTALISVSQSIVINFSPDRARAEDGVRRSVSVARGRSGKNITAAAAAAGLVGSGGGTGATAVFDNPQ